MVTRYTTYSWKFYAHSEKVKAKCRICGKTINKTISVEYREDSSPDMEYLEEKKQKWLAEDHVCAKCLKQACKSSNTKETTQSILDMSAPVAKLMQERNEVLKRLNAVLDGIADNLVGRIILVNNKEYVVDYINPCPHSESGYSLVCDKVDERMPWTTTAKYVYVYYMLNDATNVTRLEDCIITDEVFADRKAAVDKL